MTALLLSTDKVCFHSRKFCVPVSTRTAAEQTKNRIVWFRQQKTLLFYFCKRFLFLIIYFIVYFFFLYASETETFSLPCDVAGFTRSCNDVLTNLSCQARQALHLWPNTQGLNQSAEELLAATGVV